MKLSLNLCKRPLSILLIGVLFAQGSVRAEWAAVVDPAMGPGYQPVLSASDAEEKQSSGLNKTFRPLDGGFTSLSLTKSDAPQDETQQMLSPEEKDDVVVLLNEILILHPPIQAELPGAIHSEQGNHQQSQEPLETPVSNSNPKFPEAADIPSNPNPAFEGDRLGVGQGGLLEDALDREG
nr:hypothetical protein [Candidatus Omnitrophota bacterium]